MRSKIKLIENCPRGITEKELCNRWLHFSEEIELLRTNTHVDVAKKLSLIENPTYHEY